MYKDYIFMFFSLLFKMASNSIIFLLIPLFWTSTDFGTFIFLYTASSLLVLLIDYGYSVSLVKNMSIDIGNKELIFNESLNSKIFLSIITILIFIIIGIISGFNLILILLLCANIFYSFTTFFYLPLRVTGDFKNEARLTFESNFLLVIGIVLCLLLGGNILAITCVILFARIIGLFRSILYLNKYIKIYLKIDKFNSIFRQLKSNLSYAIHITVGTLFIQLDTIIVGLFLNVEEVGVYQLTIRIMLAVLILSEVLVSVYLPKLSINLKEATVFKDLANKLFLVSILIGTTVAWIMILGADFVVSLIYSEEYANVSDLLILFAIVVFVKFLSASLGILLTIGDKQLLRVSLVVVSLLVNIILNLLFIPIWGIQGAAYASLVSNIILLGCYIFSNWNFNLGIFKKNSLSILSVMLINLTFILYFLKF